MRYTALTARILYCLIFLFGGISNFSAKTIAYAASAGVPLANIAVPLSGIIAIVGALSIAIGFHARWGAILLIVFLVPVTLFMHAFWKVSDPMMQQEQLANFMKNIALLGGALAFFYFGAGPVSVDAHREVPAGRLAHA